MIERERLTELNNAPEQPGDYVLYWMQNSQRAEFNPALEVAIADANRLGLPVTVGFGLTADYPEANARHYAFMLEGLAETAHALRQRGLGLAICFGNPDDVALSLAERAALVSDGDRPVGSQRGSTGRREDGPDPVGSNSAGRARRPKAPRHITPGPPDDPRNYMVEYRILIGVRKCRQN